jgi:hypothetical protein
METNKNESREGDKLKEAAKPLQEYLAKNFHMNCKAIVEIRGVEVLEIQSFRPTLENLE